MTISYNISDYEINFLVYGTNSIFHNAGLSIYTLKNNYIDRHPISFIHNDFENVKLSQFENRISEANDDLNNIMTTLIHDAASSVKKYASSVGRQGILFSHSNLKSSMNPHIHRQGYATEVLPCITVHYRLSGNAPAQFNYWDIVSQQDAIKYDLCNRSNILQWCSNKKHDVLLLTQPKNIILFNSGLIPHSVSHTDDFNIYVVFDHVVLHNTLQYSSGPVILNE